MEKKRKIPMRLCIGCREMKPKKKLLRIVKSKEGIIEPDETGKKQGRGCYVCLNEECYSKALKTKQFQRTLSSALSKDTEQSILEIIKRKIAREQMFDSN